LDRCKLGANGPEVSRLCFGTLTIRQKNLSPEDGARLLIYARECGVNFLDTAQFYENYEPIRLALKICPDFVVCTKSYCYDETTAQQAFDQARRELGRDYIDLFLLHEQESIHTLRGHEKALEFLARQKERGYIGQTGVSTHFVSCVRSASNFPNVDVIMPLVNMRGIGVPDGTADDMDAACRLACERGAGLYGMKALGGGSLIPRREEALSYALSRPYLASVAIGMQSVDEIDCNVAFFEGRPLPQKAVERLRKQPRRLLIDNWCEGCGACVQRCKQGALTIVDGQSVVDPEKCALCGYCAAACPQFCIKIV